MIPHIHVDIREQDTPLEGTAFYHDTPYGSVIALYRLLSQPEPSPTIYSHKIGKQYSYDPQHGLILWGIAAEKTDNLSEIALAVLHQRFLKEAQLQHPALYRVMQRNRRKYPPQKPQHIFGNTV